MGGSRPTIGALARSLRRPRGIAGLGVFASLTAIGFLPLFGGPGYEHALASGVVVPAAAAIATAIEVSAWTTLAPVLAIRRGLGTGALFAGLAFATALLHGLRVGLCDLSGGAVLFFLTAGSGALAGGVWGAVSGELARGTRRRRLACVLLALAGPLGGIIVSVGRFYASPMIFSYDPFFGYFSGTLYDTVVDVRPELWTYRAGTLATLVGVAFAASALTRAGRGGTGLAGGDPGALRFVDGAGARRGALFLAAGIAALLVSLAVTLEGPALGHWQTAETITAALGGRASGPRCDVVYPDSLPGDEAALLVRDCEEELAADESRLGAHLDGRVTAFVFADANEKRRLMGAAETSIAKPWRREVYVQYAAYPHPVLGHEIAHVVSGSFAVGPFRVGGGGIVPNPGLIEGIAVATSPDDDELTDGQWARAMLDLGTLPPVRSLFSLEFLGASAQKSYTVAGAFVGWVLEQRGAAVVRAWYGGGSIEALTGQSWAELDAAFHGWLRTLAMPPEAAAYARAKFERPSVWARSCPHVVDALDRDGDRCRDEHRIARANDFYARALGRDPRDERARFARAKMASQSLDAAEAAEGRSALEAIAADERALRTWRDRAEEARADDDLVRGRDDAAEATYREIAGRTLDEDAARTLEVKALAARDPSARRAIVDLLLAPPGRPQDAWLGAFSLGEAAEAGGAASASAGAGPSAGAGASAGSPLAAYLAGRNLTSHAQYARAAPWLDRALDEGAPTARIGREVLRQRAIDACVLRDRDAIERLRAMVTSDRSPFAGSSGGRRDGLLRLLARCERD